MTASEVWCGPRHAAVERDRKLLAWCGEQYTVRTDLLAVLMAQSLVMPMLGLVAV